MRIFQIVFAVGLIAGCGGGSVTNEGTGAGSGSGTPQGLKIDGDNALYIAKITSLSNDTLTSLAQFTVLAHDELNSKPRAFAAGQPVFCRNGAQASELVTHTVPDIHYLGANQRFSIVFNQCQLAELEAEVTGELDVLVRSVTLDGYSLEISDADYLLSSSNLQLKDEDGSVQVSADINSRYNANSQRVSYTLTPAGSNLVLTLPDTKREQFSGYNTQLVIDTLSGRYQLTTSGTMQSEVLSGNASVTTVSPQSGQLQRLPDGGELRFQASGNNTMRLTAMDGYDGFFARVTLPELGLEGDIDWLELSTGASWQKTGLTKDYIWRDQADFVNLEAEWLEPGQNMLLRLLPNQPIMLHFSNVVTELTGFGSRVVLTAVDSRGLPVFAVPEIDVDIEVLGTIVRLQPAAPLLAGFRYRLGSAFARNNSSTSAHVPSMYAELVDELSGTINFGSAILSPGQSIEVYPDIRSELGPVLATWYTDTTVSESRILPNQGVGLTFADVPVAGLLRGQLKLELINSRGNQVSLEQPYIIKDEQLTDYFFNSTQPLTAAGLASVFFAPLDTQNDIGNDAGIYTAVSGFSAEGQSWSLWLRTGPGGILQPGNYAAGEEDNFSEPHIKVYIAGRSCNTESATFNVEQADYDTEQIFVKALRADYSLICQENQQRYHYHGQIRYQRGF